MNEDKFDIAWDEWTNLQQTLNAPGRYSLVGSLRDGLFKIDHLTGQTWVYLRDIDVVGTTNVVNGWMLLKDYEPVYSDYVPEVSTNKTTFSPDEVSPPVTVVTNSPTHGPWEDFRTNTPTKLDLRPVPDFDTLKPVTNSP